MKHQRSKIKPCDIIRIRIKTMGKLGRCPYCLPSETFNEKGDYEHFTCVLTTEFGYLKADSYCTLDDWVNCFLNPGVALKLYENGKQLYIKPNTVYSQNDIYIIEWK